MAARRDGTVGATVRLVVSRGKEREMMTANDIAIPAEFRALEPDVSECYGRTVEAPEDTARAAADRLELVGPLVDGLIAVGVHEHIVTLHASGIVWRFGRGEAGQVRIDWEISVAPETEDATLVQICLRATATDTASRERLFEAWPVIGPVAELHAQRVLHRIEALAEEEVDDPFRAAA
jgi:hypothetical protein